jgi:hypothetical protein
MVISKKVLKLFLFCSSAFLSFVSKYEVWPDLSSFLCYLKLLSYDTYRLFHTIYLPILPSTPGNKVVLKLRVNSLLRVPILFPVKQNAVFVRFSIFKRIRNLNLSEKLERPLFQQQLPIEMPSY